MRKFFVFLGLPFILFVFTSSTPERQGIPVQTDQSNAVQPTSLVQMQGDFGRMPLYFIANQGQMDERVAY